MAEKRNAFRALIGNLNKRGRLDDQGLDGKVILDLLLKEQDGPV
jgi:hypothetical protein